MPIREELSGKTYSKCKNCGLYAEVGINHDCLRALKQQLSSTQAELQTAKHDAIVEAVEAYYEDTMTSPRVTQAMEWLIEYANKLKTSAK